MTEHSDDGERRMSFEMDDFSPPSHAVEGDIFAPDRGATLEQDVASYDVGQHIPQKGGADDGEDVAGRYLSPDEVFSLDMPRCQSCLCQRTF